VVGLEGVLELFDVEEGMVKLERRNLGDGFKGEWSRRGTRGGTITKGEWGVGS
jgi:hypothetical protein